LSPLKKGYLTIGKASIEFDQQVFESRPINVNVPRIPKSNN